MGMEGSCQSPGADGRDRLARRSARPDPRGAHGASSCWREVVFVVVPEVGVVAPVGDEVVVSAAFNDASVVENDDVVSVGDGGAVRREGIEGLLDGVFGVGVQRAGGLIQDEDWWVAQHGARDSEALFL